jgi:hypothetical protein
LDDLRGRPAEEWIVQRALAAYTPEPGPAHFTHVSFQRSSPDGAATNPFQSPGSEKRTAPRRRVLLSALIVNHELTAAFRCQVRDVSDQGARLNIPDVFLVPAGFWLIATSSGLAYEAKLAWRRHPDAGVSLSEPIDLDEPTSRIGRKLRVMWMGAVS